MASLSVSRIWDEEINVIIKSPWAFLRPGFDIAANSFGAENGFYSACCQGHLLEKMSLPWAYRHQCIAKSLGTRVSMDSAK